MEMRNPDTLIFHGHYPHKVYGRTALKLRKANQVKMCSHKYNEFVSPRGGTKSCLNGKEVFKVLFLKLIKT